MQKTIRGILAAVVIVLTLGGIQITSEAAGRPVSIDSCLIEGTDVVCGISARYVPESDDDIYYVYANEVWQDGPTGELVAEVGAAMNATAYFPLRYDEKDSNLSRKFLVAVKQDGELVQVSDEHYITNPEALALYTSPRYDNGIKGILPDISTVLEDEFQELGVDQIVYNMYIDDICSASFALDAIPFEYNGYTYYFDKEAIESYDLIMSVYNACGIQVNMVLLNRGTGMHSLDLVHPTARDGFACPGYAINVTDDASVSHLKAICAFLGQRYSGSTGYGQVDNWILGNEINARTSWWYSSDDTLDFNVSTYVKAFRIMYNELKSMNANVRLYNSIDQEWNRKSNPGSFLAKEYLDKFNYYINREGNIDWGLSFHPYNSPLYDPYAWNGPSVWVKDDITTPYITMQNIDILIDYMHKPEFLNPYGQVRSISLAEIGYTSSFGLEAQEASVAYGYLKAASLPDVDGFLLYSQVDNAQEMESNLAMGLFDLAGNKKPSYEIYKHLGTVNDYIAKQRASAIIGMDIDTMIRENIVWTREGDGVIYQ